ncbi:WhiB family transcriptional regulator [Spirillospora sp. NPDC048911]|uniref:WhiB family transcriptional regulator n=1 Tax=Spirillospora sp. NPDC048911 TaxID=3364527 RepID=UPI003713E9CB
MPANLDALWELERMARVPAQERKFSLADETRAHHVLDGITVNGNDPHLDQTLLQAATQHIRRRVTNPDDQARILEALGLDDVPDRPVTLAPEPDRSKIRRGPRPSESRPDFTWQDFADCHGEDLVLFFGPDGERAPERELRERKAKQICAGCPVRTECADYAVSRPEKYGTWGELNEEERASERRRRQRRGQAA